MYRSVVNALTQLIVMWGVLALAGCGGGSGEGGLSNGNSDTADRNFSSDQRVIQPAKFLSGAGIKGPLAHATVELYALDSRFAALYDPGRLLSSATTDAYAQFDGLPVPGDVPPPYILLIDGNNAIDLNTGVAPVITKLVTVITKETLKTSGGIYATPYTTLAYNMLVQEFAIGGFGGLKFTGGDSAIQQHQNGLVSLEVEDFDANIPKNGHQWIDNSVSGYSGSGTLAAMPDIGGAYDVSYAEDSPRLDYKINFIRTGTHYVWIRGQKESGRSDSLHLGLDGIPVTGGHRMSISTKRLGWSNRKMGGEIVRIDVAKAGVHTLNIWMREDGAIIDKVVLTTDVNFTPSGTGPSANSREDTSIASTVLLYKLKSFGQRLTDVVGFGIPVEVDLFSTPPIITPGTDTVEEQQLVVQYRGAIEALSSLLHELSFALGDGFTADDLLVVLANDVYDDDEMNTLTVSAVASAILFQNPMIIQIANTQYQVKDIIELMDEERTYISGASAVELRTNELYVDLQTLDSEPELTGDIVSGDSSGTDTTTVDSGDSPSTSASTDIPLTSISKYSSARYLIEDFESPAWADRYRLNRNVTREGGVARRSGAYGIRIHVPQGEHWGGSIDFDHSRHGQKGGFKEVWSRYYVKFGATWGSNDGRLGKAGYRVRSDEVCGAPCLEMTDSHEANESGSIAGFSYFHRDVSESDMVSRTFKYSRRQWASDSLRETGQWYCVETHHVLNTPGQDNGVYQNWIDEKLVSDNHKISQRNTEALNIDSSVLIAYIGGGWRADRDMDIYFDDWAVSDERIGCQ